MSAVTNMPVRVLVCGGRDYSDFDRVKEVLGVYRVDEVCHGGATGADRLVWQWAQEMNVPCRVYAADWTAPCTGLCYHSPKSRNGQRYCPRAGVIRNVRMLTDFAPDLVIAFPGGSGTAHMVRTAKAAGVHVLVVQP